MSPPKKKIKTFGFNSYDDLMQTLRSILDVKVVFFSLDSNFEVSIRENLINFLKKH